MHLEVRLQDAKTAPASARLRVWNGPARRWELEDADDAAVLELFGRVGAERAVSAAAKAIAAARSGRLVDPPLPHRPPAADLE